MQGTQSSCPAVLLTWGNGIGVGLCGPGQSLSSLGEAELRTAPPGDGPARGRGAGGMTSRGLCSHSGLGLDGPRCGGPG